MNQRWKPSNGGVNKPQFRSLAGANVLVLKMVRHFWGFFRLLRAGIFEGQGWRKHEKTNTHKKKQELRDPRSGVWKTENIHHIHHDKPQNTLDKNTFNWLQLPIKTVNQTPIYTPMLSLAMINFQNLYSTTTCCCYWTGCLSVDATMLTENLRVTYSLTDWPLCGFLFQKTKGETSNTGISRWSQKSSKVQYPYNMKNCTDYS